MKVTILIIVLLIGVSHCWSQEISFDGIEFARAINGSMVTVTTLNSD